MEQRNMNGNTQETRGWEIVKALNDGLQQDGYSKVTRISAIDARKMLAEYLKLGTRRPSRLHSAILSCAVKMAVAFPDFHFVPFLTMWGFDNIRPEDTEARMTDDGKRFPSLCERMTKAYAYSVMFHPEEHLSKEEEESMKPTLVRKGYKLQEKDGRMIIPSPAVATRVFQSEVRNRTMFFVALLLPDGSDVIAEVHTITQFGKMRYDDIPNRCFNVLLRTSEKGNMRVEAAYMSNANMDLFDTAVGYIEHIDTNHKHIHVYDNESRHFVQSYITEIPFKEGTYVRFLPIIPKDSNFKSAIITEVLDGAEAFGFRDAVVTYVNEEQGYCAWELLPDETGNITPIVEKGAKDDQEPGTKGYINKSLCERIGKTLPGKGEKLKVVAFLKRGKDRKKRPVVVEFLTSET